MAEKDEKQKEPVDQAQLQEQYLQEFAPLEEGQLVDGEVVQIDSDYVYVDVGYKSEGKIPVDEFETAPKMGETVSVVLVRKEGKNGGVDVSKKKADMKAFWEVMRQAYENREPVEATFAKSIKGGYQADLGYGMTAFVPLSKADIRRVEEPESLVGIKSKFYIERLKSDGKANIVLSRRDWLEEETKKNREEFFQNTNIGDEVEGTVKSFTSFGAFVDLGGFDGLLHINDMSWGHVTRPKDYVKKGQQIKLKVIRLDEENQKINLSLKHFTEDPWTTFEDRYEEGMVATGTVTKLTDFGAFIQLEEGIEGLAHISELSWVNRISHPREVLSPGDQVDVMILGYDIQQGRISLGVKQVKPNPWDEIASKYPLGKKLTRTIKKVTNTGAFLEIEEGIDGFLHVDDLSWTEKTHHAPAVLNEGDEMEVTVIGVDTENRRVRLGVKQLSDDPWQNLAANYPKGSVIEGEVTSKTDFGIFVKVPGGVEGLVHKGNLTTDRDMPAEEALQQFNVGDQVTAVVLDVSPSKEKISLSIKDYHLKEQRKEISKYIEDENDDRVTLGDFLNQDEEG